MSAYTDWLERVRSAIFDHNVPSEGGFRVVFRERKFVCLKPGKVLEDDVVIMRLCRFDIENGLTGAQWNKIQGFIIDMLEREQRNDTENQNSNL